MPERPQVRLYERAKINAKARTKKVRDSSLSFAEQHFPFAAFLAFIGVITLSFLISSLFIHGEDGVSKITLMEDVHVGEDKFMATLSRLLNVPVEQGEPVSDYQNGDEFLPRLIESINNSQKSVTMMTYIWEEGAFSDAVVEALGNALDRNVQVLIAQDGFGGEMFKGNEEYLKNKGAKIEVYHPVSFSSIGRINERNHRRAIVVDGEHGFIGGMAISDEWLGNGVDEREEFIDFRDSMFEVRGAMAQSLQSAFSDTWYQITGTIISGEAFYGSSSYRPTSADTHPFIHVVSTPVGDSQPIQQTIALSILSAQKNIYITNPYFLPDNSLLNALIKKADEGVDISILVPGKLTDANIIRYASRDSISKLVNRGVKVYEFNPAFLHIKTIVVDGSWVIVGSANLDNRSRLINAENIMGITDSNLAARLEAIFKEDVKSSTEITKDVIASWGFFSKLLTSTSLLIEKQL